MTHAESQDLLLDLAYGELPPERAAELQSHLAGCDECQREKVALDEARRLVAPVRQLEEPGPGFDDPILAAARAQAHLEHGTVGKVIEVQGSVRPLSMEAAQVDAHRAAVRETKQRPRWAMRAALGGSVAAAAVLALVVTSSLQSKRDAERAALQKEIAAKPYEIRVAPAPAATTEVARDAMKAKLPQAPVAGEMAPAKQSAHEKQPAYEKKSARADGIAGGLESRPGSAAGRGVAHAVGSGGDVLGALSAKDVQGAAQPPPAAAAAPPSTATASKGEPAVPVVRSMKAEAPRRELDDVAQNNGAVAVASTSAKAAPEDAAALERQAEQSRIGGSYGDAATFYRRAAAARGSDSAAAAWDLAHAVECLATAGRFDEARQVRAELLRLHPSEKTASSAANRALRSVEIAPPEPR